MGVWVKTKYTGVRYREHATRKHGIQKDRYFSIRYKHDGKDREEALGWASEGWTAEKAALELANLKNNRRTGEGHHSLQEKREAEAAKREAEERERALAEKASTPFAAIWKIYLEQCNLDGKKSCDREESLFRLWIEPVIGKRPLKEVTAFHLEKIKHAMSKAGLSPRSIHYCLAVVRQVFNFAIRRDIFDGANPTMKVKKPTADNRRMRYLTHEEAAALLDEIKARSINSWRICLLSLHAGLRFGEIAGLTYGDIDLERNTLWIRDPKNGYSRHVPMTATLREMLLDLEGKGNDDLLFPDRNGGRRRAMSDTFDRVLQALKFNEGITDDRQKVVFHTLRHTHASWHMENGTDLFVVKELLGHRSIQMTERYSHIGQSTMRNAIDKLADAISERS
ncbi:site-specific integrase [Desulforhabdus sp. TSK]|uniref:tyrosine-type recombinase/integrase n=1 Tax=Desulforhabdus sp. TSK TaxID=2925014 RepID=UPI001FC8337C|nr:site-specific integrase [Desulforhabdus sp. TSK]GKT07635.1 integrase [Desulforhabdus sp. TSK]